MYVFPEKTRPKISLFIDNKRIHAISHLNFLGLLIDETLS